MLPTREYKEFSKRQTVVATRTNTADAESLRSEFSLPNFNVWMIVLNEKGETLDLFCPDNDSECNETSKFLFAGNVVARLDKALKESLSIQELERRWRAKPEDAAAFEGLAEKLDRIQQRRRLSKICADALKQPSLPIAAKTMIECQAFLAEARDFVYDGEAGKDALTRRGETLLVKHPDHALATKVQAALTALLKEGFDVPARWNASVFRMEQACANPSAAQKTRMLSFKKERDEFLTVLESARKTPEIAANEPALLWYSSLLGDAKTTVRLLEKPEFRDNPQYAAILRQAKAKLAAMR